MKVFLLEKPITKTARDYNIFPVSPLNRDPNAINENTLLLSARIEPN